MRHIIKLEDFESPYIIYHEISGSYGESSHKSLLARINLSNKNISYEIKEHDKTIHETSLFDKAIDFYNELE